MARTTPNTASGGSSAYSGFLVRLGASGLIASTMLNAMLQSLVGLASAANKIPYFSGADTFTLTDFTATGRDLVGAADAAAVRTALALGDLATMDQADLNLGTMASQNANAVTLAGDMDADGYTINNLADAVNNDQPATYGQLLAMVNGRDFKQSVRAYRGTQLPAYSYSGGVITFSGNGSLPSQDGITLQVGDRFLIAGETAGNQKYNGCYDVTSTGSAGSPVVLTRSADSNTSALLTTGATYYVEEGTSYGGKSVKLSTAGPITLDTTALTFTVESGVSLSSAAPENLAASASAGSSSNAARADHVHSYTGLLPTDGSVAMTGQLIQAGVAQAPVMVSSNATDVVTSNYVAVNTTGGAVTRSLPESPADGTVMIYRLLAGSNALTIQRSGSTDQIVEPGSSPANSITVSVVGEEVTLRYFASLDQWMA